VSPAPPPALLDEAVFQEHAARHRRELHVHCYRMLASFDEAEDAVQETLLNAWRHRDQFDATGPLRAWLYRIATNACLDMIRARGRRPQRAGSPDVGWLQPYPDRLLDEVAAPDDGPDAIAVSRETVELAFLTALQVLPARQRAALLLRDVLGMTAAETAELLDTSVPAANSALQRARATMAQHLPAQRSGWSAGGPNAQERELLARFVDAHERGDAAAALAAAAPDIRVTMPPYPNVFEGHERLTELLVRAFGPDRDGDWRLLPTAANRMPAAASYLCRPGDTIFRPFKLDVLAVEAGRIREITTFGPELFEAFGLPAQL
jgi:RNA polymerase sigma-70 factor (TIGR02960 family)